MPFQVSRQASLHDAPPGPRRAACLQAVAPLMKYRPEIDGLRTVAVLPVVFFHARLGPFHGGFAGVDIFFVISGYLITSLIIGDLEAGSFSVRDFYERRARRILPALFLVLVVSSIAAWKWMYPLELNEHAQGMVAAVFFSSNIFFWLKSDYFSTAAELKPLLHTWSLAVEEQYYLFFPPLMAFLWKGSRRHARVLAILAGLAAASMAATLAFGNAWGNADFYLLPFRAWELLVGAICAIVLARWTVPARPAVALAGLALIAMALFFGSDQGWPSWQTLLPTLGTALVILFASQDHGAGRVLASRPMIAVGLISYSLYLWHQPLFAFARLRLPDEPSAGSKLAITAAAVVLAGLTWRFVEQPFRARRNRRFVLRARPLALAMAVGATAITTVGLAIDAGDGWPGRTAPSGLSFAGIERDLAGARVAKPCDVDLAFRPVPAAPLPDCVFPAAGQGEPRRAILLGDSHATVLTPALVDRLTMAGYDTAVATFGGCIPFAGYRTAARDCDAANAAMLRHVADARYDLVVLAFRPQHFMTGEEKVILAGSGKVPDNPSASIYDLIGTGLQRLLDTGARVIVFEPVPEMARDIGHFARNRFAFDPDHRNLSFSTPFGNYLDRAGPALDVLRAGWGPDLTVIPTSRILCDDGRMLCWGVEKGVALYTDDNHLSVFGVNKLMAGIDARMLPNPSGH